MCESKLHLVDESIVGCRTEAWSAEDSFRVAGTRWNDSSFGTTHESVVEEAFVFCNWGELLVAVQGASRHPFDGQREAFRIVAVATNHCGEVEGLYTGIDGCVVAAEIDELRGKN